MANGPKIRKLRKGQGLSQESLATAIGCDVKTIHHAELGKRVHMDTLVKLAQALGVELQVIHIGSDDPDEFLELRLRKIDHWRSSFGSMCVESLVGVYHEDAHMAYPGLDALYHDGKTTGKAVIRAQFDLLFREFQFDPWPEVSAYIHAAENFVFLRGEVTGTVRQTGVRFTSRAIHEFEFAGKCVRRHVGMFDTSSMKPMRS